MNNTRPTVLLVHGAFADGSSWKGVVAELQADGVPVRALAHPLRGLYADAAYVAHAAAKVDGPVLLGARQAVRGGCIGGGLDDRVLENVTCFEPERGQRQARGGLGRVIGANGLRDVLRRTKPTA